MENRKVEVKMYQGTKINGDGNSIPVFEGHKFAFFHKWEDYKNEDMSCTFGIIELEENGEILRVEPTRIRFLKPE